MKKGDPSTVKTYMKGASKIEIGRYTYGYQKMSVRQWAKALT
ncbi:hypothetical protein [uncultured Shimia sp.]|nr:hypothetical protein [uncultured Shimia sp.]